MMMTEDQNALAHYGVKGMHWGQRNYQYKDGTYTDLGKARRRVGYKEAGTETETKENTEERIGGKAYKDMSRKELRAAKKRARHNEKERRATREFNRDKAQAIADGDLAFISKNISRFSNEEIDDAVNRYKKMQTLLDLNKANQKDAEHFIDKATKWLEKGAKVSQQIANISNNFNDMATKAANRKKAQVEYEYTKDPSLKPLTEEQKQKARTSEESANKFAVQKEQEKEILKQKQIETAEKQLPFDEAKAAKQEAIDARKEAKRMVDEAKARIKNAYDAQSEWDLAVAQEELKAKEQAEKEAEREAERARIDVKRAEKEAKKQRKEIKRLAEEEERNYKLYKEAMKAMEEAAKEEAKQEKIRVEESNKKVSEDMKEIYDEDDYKWSWFGGKSKGGKQSQNDSPSKEISADKPTVRDKRWYKELKRKPGDSRLVDKWVNEMKNKYIKERGMSKEAAEEKAEEYVDYWLDLYDEGAFDKKK